MQATYNKSGWSVYNSDDPSKFFIEFYFNESIGYIVIDTNKVTAIRVFEVQIAKNLPQALFGRCSICHTIIFDSEGKIEALSSPFCSDMKFEHFIVGNYYESELLDEKGKKFMTNKLTSASLYIKSLPTEMHLYFWEALGIVKKFEVNDQKLIKHFYFWKTLLYFSVIYSKLTRRINIFASIVYLYFLKLRYR